MFDIHQTTTDENGDWDDAAVENYCNGLMDEFAASPEGVAAAEHLRGLGWTHSFLDFAFNYLGSAPPELSRANVDEILFDLFPRKVSTEPESAAEIISELRAFFEFLHRQYGLSNAKEILHDLGKDATGQLERELANPENFGLAKSFFAMGNEAGFDMTTQEGMNEFMEVYNAAIAQRHASPAPSAPHPSAKERKSREKLRRKKLGKSKRRR